MKRTMKADTLGVGGGSRVSAKVFVCSGCRWAGGYCLQAENAKEDDPVEMEHVGDAQCEAEDHA